MSVDCTNESHEQLKQPDRWAELELRGHMADEFDDGRPARLELRQCGACQSTLAIRQEVTP